jgi:murein L,D-transpeptidase YcbB/YkuD
VRRLALVPLLIAFAAAGCSDERHRDLIRATVDVARPPTFTRPDKDGRRVWAATQSFYRSIEFAPVWVKRDRPTTRMESLLSAIDTVDRDGLDPALYDTTFLRRDGAERKLPNRFPSAAAGEIDVRLTYLYMQLAADLADGVSDLAHADRAWRIQPETFDPANHLTKALAGGGIADSLEALKPATAEYRALRNLLAEYRSAKPGVASSSDDRRDERIRQIALNLERWRWVPRTRGARHIVVNIPAFRLDGWEDNRSVLSMRVVVGKKDTRTPIFNDEMTHLVFSPYWNVPPTIAVEETLPSIMRDPSFLARTNMEVLDGRGRIVDPSDIDPERPEAYRFRQRPGSDNSLGLVKFMFPNEYNVYLHDTPADSLFARASRSFSHGCVRVEDPQALAEYVLKDQPEWTRERIVEAMHAGDERTVTLRQSIPVYIGYWTVDVAPDGRIEFKPDVYGLDARQSAALTARLATLRASTQLVSRANP